MNFLSNKDSPSLDDILELVKKITKIENNIYFGKYMDNKSLELKKPKYDSILIYMTKKKENCYALVNEMQIIDEDNKIEYFNLKSKKKCKRIQHSLLNLEYYYILLIKDELDDVPKKRKVKSKKKKPKMSGSKVMVKFDVYGNKIGK